jgi:hypothetical protein
MNETVVEYVDDKGDSFGVDHLGIGHPETQWGEFAVYRNGVQLAEFAVPDAALKPEFRKGLPSLGELVELAKQAVAEADRE